MLALKHKYRVSKLQQCHDNQHYYYWHLKDGNNVLHAVELVHVGGSCNHNCGVDASVGANTKNADTIAHASFLYNKGALKGQQEAVPHQSPKI